MTSDNTPSKASGSGFHRNTFVVLVMLVVFTVFNGIVFYVIPNMNKSDITPNPPTYVSNDQEVVNNLSTKIKSFDMATSLESDNSKCVIQRYDPMANLYAKNCSYDSVQSWLINNTSIHMGSFERKFFTNSAIGNEKAGIVGDTLFGGGPFGFFMVQFDNGTTVVFGNYNGTDIYPFYQMEMAKICNHMCQNGDMP